MDREFFRENRRRFLAGMEEDSLAVFFSDPQFPDEMQPAFQPYIDRNFFYLAGMQAPGLCLVLRKKTENAIIYGDSADLTMACREYASLLSDLIALVKSGERTVYFFTYKQSPLEEKNKCGELAYRLQAAAGAVEWRNSYDLLRRLRRRKQPCEVEEIRQAIGATGRALEYMAKRLQPGIWEYQALADFDYSLAREGKAVSFQMGASGPNAMILHYLQSGRQAADGEMILFDLGACSSLYTSDISRTYPVSGRFTPRQRQIYDIVLEAQAVALEHLGVGSRYVEINQAVKDFYAKALKAIGLILDKDEVERYYYHNVGHPMGLYVHDPGSPEDLVMENGVYTLEPGLYLKEEGFGIRIEDNYLITKNGPENLSAAIPKRAEEIEALMAR